MQALLCLITPAVVCLGITKDIDIVRAVVIYKGNEYRVAAVNWDKPRSVKTIEELAKEMSKSLPGKKIRLVIIFSNRKADANIVDNVKHVFDKYMKYELFVYDNSN